MGNRPVAEFWGNYDWPLDIKKFHFAIDKLLHDTEKSIHETSKTAKAIARKDSLETISQFARQEGFADLFQVLDFAIRYREKILKQ
ncbi:MAG: hypothetical protein ACE5E9_06515 [Nitrospinaceae bacterium]